MKTKILLIFILLCYPLFSKAQVSLLNFGKYNNNDAILRSTGAYKYNVRLPQNIQILTTDSIGNLFGVIQIKDTIQITDKTIYPLFGKSDFGVVKINPYGKVIWCRIFGTELNDRATSIVYGMKDGNIYVTAQLINQISYPSSPKTFHYLADDNQWKTLSVGVNCGIILKLNPEGKVMHYLNHPSQSTMTERLTCGNNGDIYYHFQSPVKNIKAYGINTIPYSFLFNSNYYYSLRLNNNTLLAKDMSMLGGENSVFLTNIAHLDTNLIVRSFLTKKNQFCINQTKFGLTTNDECAGTLQIYDETGILTPGSHYITLNTDYLYDKDQIKTFVASKKLGIYAFTSSWNDYRFLGKSFFGHQYCETQIFSFDIWGKLFYNQQIGKYTKVTEKKNLQSFMPLQMQYDDDSEYIYTTGFYYNTVDIGNTSFKGDSTYPNGFILCTDKKFNPIWGYDWANKDTNAVSDTGYFLAHSGRYTYFVGNAQQQFSIGKASYQPSKYTSNFLGIHTNCTDKHYTLQRINNGVYCNSDSTALYLANLPKATFQWYEDSVFVAYTHKQKFIPPKPGKYWAQVKDSLGCVGTTDTVTVLAVNPIPQVQLGLDKEICQGDSIKIGVTPTNGSHYQWNTGDTSAQHFVKQPNSYILTQTFTATGCKNSDTINISVNPLPVFSLGNDTLVTSGSQIIIGLPLTMGYRYQWTTGDTLHFISPVVVKDTIFGLWAYSSKGCKNFDDMKVSILTGLDEQVTDKSIQLYPNPADNFILIIQGVNQSANLRITDLNGKSLYQQPLQASDKQQINTMLPQGMYLVEITLQNQVVMKKWMVR